MKPNNLPRYSTIYFPACRYLPKQNHKAGNFAQIIQVLHQMASIEEFSKVQWQNSTIYRYAIDLFNNQYFWEIHEVLEILWHQVGKKSLTGIFLQGLIQTSVSLLKKEQGNKPGAKSLLTKALLKFKQIPKGAIFMGIDVDEFMQKITDYLNDEQEIPPRILLKFKPNIQGYQEI